MARAKAEHDVKGDILRAAGVLFHEYGYDGTSMKDIADRVGVTPAGLYWHFDSKEAILSTYLETAVERLIATGLEALSLDDPVDQLREITRRHVIFQVQDPTQSAVFDSVVYGANQLRQGLSESSQERLTALERRYLNTLRNILEAGAARGSFAVENTGIAALAIIGMGEHVIHWFRPGGELTIEQVADQFADFAVRMVAAEQPDRPAAG